MVSSSATIRGLWSVFPHIKETRLSKPLKEWRICLLVNGKFFWSEGIFAWLDGSWFKEVERTWLTIMVRLKSYITKYVILLVLWLKQKSRKFSIKKLLFILNKSRDLAECHLSRKKYNIFCKRKIRSDAHSEDCSAILHLL